MTAKKPTPTQRGSVLIRKDGRLELRAYAGKNPAGKDPYIREYFPAGTDPESKQVRNALTALVARADDLAATRKRRRKVGSHAPAINTRPASARTCGAILEAWYTEVGRHMPTASTVRTYLDSYLLPELEAVDANTLRGSVQRDEVDAPDLFDLAKFFDRLLAKGAVGGRPGHPAAAPLAPATVGRAKSYLKQAIDLEMLRVGTTLTSNPCAQVRLPGVTERESTMPEPDEMAEFLPFLSGAARIRPAHAVTRRRKDGTSYTFIMPERVDAEAADRSGRMLLAYGLLVGSGPRPEEVSGLQRGNLDRLTGELRLDAVGIVDGKLERGETDKRRKRTIWLDSDTLAAVNDHLRHQDEVALQFGVRLTRRSYLFSDKVDCSTFVDPGTPSQAFGRVVEAAVKAGIPIPPKMRLYDMRHYGITLLCRSRKVPTADIAWRYATSIEMIERRYNHRDPGGDRGLAAALEGAWGNPGQKTGVVLELPDQTAVNRHNGG
jgi:integrase